MNGLEMMSLEPKALSLLRPIFHGTTAEWVKGPQTNYDILQPKHDGWFAYVKGTPEHIQIINKAGDVRGTYPNESGQSFLLQGEWMFGTEWSSRHHPGAMLCFDIAFWQEFDLTGEVYANRLSVLESFVKVMAPVLSLELMMITTWPLREVDKVWKSHVDSHEYEGLVFKNSQQTFFEMVVGRAKGTVADEFILTQIVEGGGKFAGKMGAIVGSMWQDGKLVGKVAVGGGFSDEMRAEFWLHREEWIGRVFEAYGFQQFPSGSLRHPQWMRFRPDKPADECVWPHK